MSEDTKKASGSDLVVSDFAGGKGDPDKRYRIPFTLIATILTLIMAFYYVHGGIGLMEILGTYLLLNMAMVFFPKSRDSKPKQIVDIVLLILSVVVNV